MQACETLVRETRGGRIDIVHYGCLAIVGESGQLLYSVGDPATDVFMRSAAKPIQALPVIARGLDKRYGLTEEETALFSGSHAGEPYHIAAMERIMEKAGFSEDILCMKPAAPYHGPSNKARVQKGLPRHKYYHNCSGKHAALLLLQRELGGAPEAYWQPGALCQQEVERAIRCVSETDAIGMGIDGCGVPVFATALQQIAIAFKNLAHPEAIADEALQRAAATYIPRMHRYPHMVRGTGYLCTILNGDENIVAKCGANGVYAFGLKKERIGVAFKLIDGTDKPWALIAREVLRGLGALTPETEARLASLHPDIILNDNGTEVGRCETGFHVAI